MKVKKYVCNKETNGLVEFVFDEIIHSVYGCVCYFLELQITHKEQLQEKRSLGFHPHVSHVNNAILRIGNLLLEAYLTDNAFYFELNAIDLYTLMLYTSDISEMYDSTNTDPTIQTLFSVLVDMQNICNRMVDYLDFHYTKFPLQWNHFATAMYPPFSMNKRYVPFLKKIQLQKKLPDADLSVFDAPFGESMIGMVKQKIQKNESK